MARFAQSIALMLLMVLIANTTVRAQGEWESLGLDGETVNDVCVDPWHSETVFAACENGLYRTLDFGETWTLLSATPVRVIAVSDAEPELLFAAGPNYLARSTDNGYSWNPVWQEQEIGILAVKPHPTNSDIAYVRRADGVWHSTDGGDTWSHPWVDETNYETDALVVLPGQPANVYTITADSIYFSESYGFYWSTFPGPDPDPYPGPIYPLVDLIDNNGLLNVAGPGVLESWHDWGPWDPDWWEDYWYMPDVTEWQGTIQDVVGFWGAEALLITDQELVHATTWVWDPNPLDDVVPFFDPTIITCATKGYLDADVLLGTDGSGVWYNWQPVYIGVDEQESAATPSGFTLHPARPNPFNASTRITLELDRPRQVMVEVVDLLGRRVAVLHDGLTTAGMQEFVWEASREASGIYLVRAVSDVGELEVTKVVLLR